MAKRILLIFTLAALTMLIAAGAVILHGNSSSGSSSNYEAETTVYGSNVIISEILV